MTRIQNPNFELLTQAVEYLGPLVDELVFVGGCAAGLLITDPASSPLRVTRDVDAIVQAVSTADYYQFADRLRERGFKEYQGDDAMICRWVFDHVLLDVMPVETKVLGFGNKWYALASEHAIKFKLPGEIQIRMVSAPFFLLTKFEAFDGRGKGDYLFSHDIEDIIAVIDGRSTIVNEVKDAPSELISALSSRLGKLIHEQLFIDAISGHLPSDQVSQARAVQVLEKLRIMSRL